MSDAAYDNIFFCNPIFHGIGKYIAANGGDYHGLMVSTGGGMPMGAAYEKTRALIRAAREYRL